MKYIERLITIYFRIYIGENVHYTFINLHYFVRTSVYSFLNSTISSIVTIMINTYSVRQ